MKTSEIQVGKTYTNKAGTRQRTVTAIKPATAGCTGMDVHYTTPSVDYPCHIFLSSFAAWATREVPTNA